MFNLNEEWKKAYDLYLDEQYDKLDDNMASLFEEMEQVQKDVELGFTSLKEYFCLLAEEGSLGPVETKDYEEEKKKIANTQTQDNKSDISSSDKKDVKTNKDYAANIVNVFGGLLKADELAARNDNSAARSYQPIQSVVSVQNITDMKFPQNIVFFIKQLISWIKNLVIYFIDKIKNFLSLLLRGKKVEPRLTKDELKLSFDKVKKLEVVDGVSDNKTKSDGKVIKMYNLPLSDYKISEYIPLRENLSDLFTGGEKAASKGNAVIITVDLSRDMLQLKELVQHFYDLFDNAFGSNNEQLYDTTDLELILKVFKDTLAGLKSGRSSMIQVGSKLGAVEAISADRVRDNLINTNANIEALKGAYTATKAKLTQTSSIITNKELMMANSMGVDFKVLSSATYQEMIYILDTITPRLKEAEKMQKKLEVMQRAFNSVSEELKKMQQNVMALGNVSYQSVYQRQFVDMFNASRYMTQIVTLRLSGIGIYIRELKDVETIIETLANLNKGKRK